MQLLTPTAPPANAPAWRQIIVVSAAAALLCLVGCGQKGPLCMKKPDGGQTPYPPNVPVCTK